MFLDRFVEDPDHTEFAWLVTRCLWGDLQDALTPDLVVGAEELSRSLRRRLAQAHPSTVRFVAPSPAFHSAIPTHRTSPPSSATRTRTSPW